jgi:hypothetical protein
VPVLLGESLQRLFQQEVALVGDGAHAGRELVGRQGRTDRRRRAAVIEPDLAASRTLGGLAITPDELGDPVPQAMPEPDEQLRLRVARELAEVPQHLDEGLLDEVRGAPLGLEAGIQVVAGDPEQVAAAAVEQPPQGLARAGAGLVDQLHRLAVRLRHRHAPIDSRRADTFRAIVPAATLRDAIARGRRLPWLR